MTQYLILTPGTEPEVRNSNLDYNAITAMVGHPAEITNIEGGRALMYSNSEGNKPRNEQATRLAAGSLRNGGFIAGTALLVGPMGPGGVDTDLPDAVLADMLDHLQNDMANQSLLCDDCGRDDGTHDESVEH